MVYIFVKLIWNQHPVHPMIRLVSTQNQKFSEMPLVVGDEFNIKIRQRKLCIGTEIAGLGWTTCIANQNRLNKLYKKAGVQQERPVAAEYTQCLDCRSSSYFSCRQICIGKECNPSSQEAFDHCQGPQTSVYLTHLGGQLKVGVSLNVQRRWLEQGSDYGIELIKLPGLEARRLEQQISKDLNLKLQVRNTAKIRDFQPMRSDFAIGEIEDKLDDIKKIIDINFQEIEKVIEDPNHITNLTQYYGNINPDRPIQLIDINPTVEFGGIIDAVKGSIIVVRNGIYLFGIDTKALTGHTFDLLDRTASMSGQKSLDEWF